MPDAELLLLQVPLASLLLPGNGSAEEEEDDVDSPGVDVDVVEAPAPPFITEAKVDAMRSIDGAEEEEMPKPAAAADF